MSKRTVFKPPKHSSDETVNRISDETAAAFRRLDVNVEQSIDFNVSVFSSSVGAALDQVYEDIESVDADLQALRAAPFVIWSGSIPGSANERRIDEYGGFTKLNTSSTGLLSIDFAPDSRFDYEKDDFKRGRTGTVMALSGTNCVGELGWFVHSENGDQTISAVGATDEHPGVIRITCARSGWTALSARGDDLAGNVVDMKNIRQMGFVVKMGGSITGKKVYLGFANTLNPSGSQAFTMRFVLDQSLSGSNWFFETINSVGAVQLTDTGINCPTDTFQGLSFQQLPVGTWTAYINKDPVAQHTNTTAGGVNYGMLLSSSNATAGNRELDIDWFTYFTLPFDGGTRGSPGP